MKLYICILMILSFVLSYAQGKREYQVKDNTIYVTHFYQDDTIKEKGTFNMKKELHGKWVCFDNKGNLVTTAYYQNGKKEGVWKYTFANGTVEVTYSQNIIKEVKDNRINQFQWVYQES